MDMIEVTVDISVADFQAIKDTGPQIEHSDTHLRNSLAKAVYDTVTLETDVYQITIKSPERSFKIWVQEDFTFARVMDKIERLHDIRQAGLVLAYGGDPMQAGDTLSRFGIEEDDTLHLASNDFWS